MKDNQKGFAAEARASATCSFRSNSREFKRMSTKIFVARVRFCDWFCEAVRSGKVDPVLSLNLLKPSGNFTYRQV
jgi:hypothetical protein